jgi:hypothetical protein
MRQQMLSPTVHQTHVSTQGFDGKAQAMDLNDTDTPGVDLAGAEVYVEAGDRPVAGGRWHIVPNPDTAPAGQPELVVYQRPNGKYAYKSMVTAHDLRTSPTWTSVGHEHRPGVTP